MAVVGLCAGCAKPSAPATFQADVKYAQVGDVKLAYYVRGEGEPLLIRHPESVDKAVRAAANPGGSQAVPADKAVEDKLNDPDIALDQKLALLFPPGDCEEALAEEIYSRILAAGKQGSAPDDFTVSKETALRQNRVRTTLWDADEFGSGEALLVDSGLGNAP